MDEALHVSFFIINMKFSFSTVVAAAGAVAASA